MPPLTPALPTRAGHLAALRRSQRRDVLVSARMSGRLPMVLLYTTRVAARPLLTAYARSQGWKVNEDAFFDRPGRGRRFAMACSAAESPSIDAILTINQRILPAHTTDVYERTLQRLARHRAFLDFVPPTIAGLR